MAGFVSPIMKMTAYGHQQTKRRVMVPMNEWSLFSRLFLPDDSFLFWFAVLSLEKCWMMASQMI